MGWTVAQSPKQTLMLSVAILKFCFLKFLFIDWRDRFVFPLVDASLGGVLRVLSTKDRTHNLAISRTML